jgi:hypothetical protein
MLVRHTLREGVARLDDDEERGSGGELRGNNFASAEVEVTKWPRGDVYES